MENTPAAEAVTVQAAPVDLKPVDKDELQLAKVS